MIIIIVIIACSLSITQQQQAYRIRQVGNNPEGIIEILEENTRTWMPLCQLGMDQGISDIMCIQLGYKSANSEQPFYAKDCGSSEFYQDNYYTAFGVDLSEAFNSYYSCDSSMSLDGCFFEKSIPWGYTQYCSDGDCVVLNCTNDSNETPNDQNSNTNNNIPKGKSGQIKKFGSSVGYYSGSQWLFFCNEEFDKDMGNHLCKKLGYWGVDKQSKSYCDFESYPYFSREQGYSFDCSALDNNYKECDKGVVNFGGTFSDCSQDDCVRIKCKDTPVMLQTTAIIIYVAVYVFIWLIFCIVYNRRHNQQLKQRAQQYKLQMDQVLANPQLVNEVQQPGQQIQFQQTFNNMF